MRQLCFTLCGIDRNDYIIDSQRGVIFHFIGDPANDRLSYIIKIPLFFLLFFGQRVEQFSVAPYTYTDAFIFRRYEQIYIKECMII